MKKFDSQIGTQIEMPVVDLEVFFPGQISAHSYKNVMLISHPNGLSTVHSEGTGMSIAVFGKDINISWIERTDRRAFCYMEELTEVKQEATKEPEKKPNPLRLAGGTDSPDDGLPF